MSFRLHSINSLLIIVIATAFSCTQQQRASAQALGVELHAMVNPAAGGMGGVSIAKPQDVQSAFTGNPATLTQMRGTQFAFGGAWVEPTIKIDNDTTLPIAGVTPYESRSEQPGNALGNIAVTQDLTAFDLPVTFGAAFLSGAGLGVKYLNATESNGSAASLLALNIASGVGVQVTERLSVGAQAYVTFASLDGPFSGLSVATPAYSMRGLFGATYDATDYTTLGFYWMTKQNFTFEDAVRLSIGAGAFDPVTQDIKMDLPETFGWGIANDRLCDGRLLLASDILYKRYSDTDFFGAIWDDQFVLQTGMQFKLTHKIRLRAGYTYADNIMLDDPAGSIGGVIPPNVAEGAMRYLQAQFPAISQHRISAGVGVHNILPGVDLDLNAGGMLDADDFFGQPSPALNPGAGANVVSYWISMGLTWRFGRGACERLPIPNQWDKCSDVGCGLR